jgi:hypothetical protein
VKRRGYRNFFAHLPFRSSQLAGENEHPAAVVAVARKVAPDNPQPGIDTSASTSETSSGLACIKVDLHIFNFHETDETFWRQIVQVLLYIPRIVKK